MKWISVKEKLPEYNKSVIVAKIFQGYNRNAIAYDIAYYTDCWRYSNGGDELEYTPDYWAPIAPLPKDGE